MKRAVILVMVVCVLPLAAQPAPPPGWRIFGSNELTVENFDVSGERTVSPFRFEGTYFTNRSSVNLAWSDGVLRDLLIRGEFVGTDSEYLPDRGLVVATLALRFEDGGAAVPYRLEAGDVFADLSRRVLQRQLRGTSIELQPQFGRGTHSILIVTGSGAPQWRDTFRDGNDLYFTAASWLWQSVTETTSVVANVAAESAKAGAVGAFPVSSVDRDHLMASLSAKTAFSGVNIEGEVSLLDADGEEDGASFYAEAARGSGPFTWRARYEDNDEHYVPFGAMGVLAGRESGELHGRWRISRRSTLSGRAQQIEQRFASSSRSISTDVAALRFATEPVRSRPGLRLDANVDVNRIESSDGLQDVLFRNAGLELRDDFDGRFDLTWRAALRDTSDRSRPGSDRRALENEVIAGVPFLAAGWTGRLGAGVAYHRYRESASFESLSPLVEVSVRNGAHFIRVYYGIAQQRFSTVSERDLRYQNRRLLYTFSRSNHHVSLEYGQELREPEILLDTDSKRVALRYRYTFDRSL